MSSEQLKRITGKLQELVKNYDNLKKENERLRGELRLQKKEKLVFWSRSGTWNKRSWS